MHIEKIAIDLLVPYARNTRTHSDQQLGQIANSIKEFGFTNPVLIDADGGIIAGHGRVIGARKLGLTEVPCIRLAHLTEVQKRAYVIADNKLSDLSGWDDELLALELGDLKELAFDLDLLGFSADELIGFLTDPDAEGLTDPDDVPAPPEQPIIKPGDVWLLGSHRIMCGDSTKAADVDKLMAGKKADVLFTDPPYGIKRDKGFGGFDGFGGFGEPIARRTYADDWDTIRPDKNCFELILSISKIAIIFGGNFFTDILPKGNHWLVWDKKNTMPTFGDCELVWTNVDRTSVKRYEVVYNGLIGKERERFHPTQKPVKIIELILMDYSDLNNLIFDPFLGSGTTLIAAEQTNRRCYAMEISPAYIDISVQRWQNYTGQQATLEATGERFNDLAELRQSAPEQYA